MSNTKLSPRELIMVAVLVVLLAGLGYRVFFYNPLQEELAAVATQSSELDGEIARATAKTGQKKKMQAELDEIFAQPEDKIWEIASFDNKKVVLSMLYGTLARTENYSVNFDDPEEGEDGTVRRNASLSFDCESYSAAKAVIRDLTDSKWRCVVRDCFISDWASDFYHDTEDEEERTEGILSNPVSVSMTITFLESTRLD